MAGGARPPAGYAIVVGYVQPGAKASELGLKLNMALISINGESMKGVSCKDAMRSLNASKRDERRLVFLEFAARAGVRFAPDLTA